VAAISPGDQKSSLVNNAQESPIVFQRDETTKPPVGVWREEVEDKTFI